MEEEFDPFALGGYAEEDEEVESIKSYLNERVAKPERQQSLFTFVKEAIERKKGGSDA